MYVYDRATVIRVVDGDTVHLRVDVGFRLSYEGPFRLLGLDAPEITGPEKEEGLRWKAGLESLLPVGGTFPCQTLKPDSFGRWLAVVTIDGRAVTEILKERMGGGA